MSKVFRRRKFWTNSPSAAAAGGNTFRIASTGNFPGCGAFADFREMFCAAPFRAVLSTPATFSWLSTPNNGPIIIKIGQWLSKTANLANVEAALGLCFNILCSQNFLESWTFGKGHEEEGLTPAMQVRAKFSAFPPNTTLDDRDKQCWRRKVIIGG